MRCFYCFWSQRKLSCVSFNPITRFFIFTLRLSAPLSRSFTPSSAQESLPHGLFELGARVFLRMQADSPEPTWPEPSLPEKTPTEWIEPLTSEHSAILHPPTTGTHTHTQTHTHTHTPLHILSRLPQQNATQVSGPSQWITLISDSIWASAGITWYIWKCQARWVRREQFKRSWESL